MIYEIFKDIVIPLLSALIGGGVTFWGIKKTIRHEQTCRKEDEKRYYKPFFIALNKYDDKVKGKITKIDFENNETNLCLINGYVQNFDFSHFCIEKIVVNDISYYPVTNAVIEKNAIVQVNVFGDKKDIQTAELYIHDILGNQYLYELEFEENTEPQIKIITNFNLLNEV